MKRTTINNHVNHQPGWLWLFCVLLWSAGTTEAASITRLEVDAIKAHAAAVIVDHGATLAQTAQLMPLDAAGNVRHKGDPFGQVQTVFANLDKVLTAAEADRGAVVKLNFYLADEGVGGEVRVELVRRFGKELPAVSYVGGLLPKEGVLLAVDAVFIAGKTMSKTTGLNVNGLHPVPGGSHLHYVPPNPKAYVSGMASQGSLAEATEKTLAQLWDVLEFLSAAPEQVTQFKVFLNPMSQHGTVTAAIARRYPDGKIPVITFVEWASKTPVEIEMVVSLPDETAQKRLVVEYLTPTGLKASPLYSRVVKVHSGKEIYFSGLYGDLGTGGEEQTAAVFNQLRRLSEMAGSDMRHLVKATYYVTTEETSLRLNSIRPDYYDRMRPPAASKAAVRGTGMTGRHITVDMIAVTKE